MDKPVQFLNDYVMSKASGEPLAKRAQIYRALALVAGVKKEARRLIQLAIDLESIERRHRQLRLDLGDDQDGGKA